MKALKVLVPAAVASGLLFYFVGLSNNRDTDSQDATASSSVVTSCDSSPPTVSPDVPNSIDLIISDSLDPHEGQPHGIPEDYLWRDKPLTHEESVPAKFKAVTGWGQIYEDSCGNNALNTRVEIYSLRTYALSRTNDEWRLLQSAPTVEGAAFVEDFVDDANRPADVRSEPGGGISVTSGQGYNFHFWPPQRTPINPTDVSALYVTVQARLILNDPAGPDDRSESRYLLDVGGDLWLDTKVEFDNFETNADFGLGRLKYVTTGWQSFNMLYADGGVDEAVVRSNPPPFEPPDTIKD